MADVHDTHGKTSHGEPLHHGEPLPHQGAPMGENPFARPPGHEREIDRDINIRGLSWTILGLFILTVFSMFVMWWMFESMLAAKVEADPEPPPLVEAREQIPPPPPRLQAAPERDLEQWNAHQNALRTSYAWQDEAGGVARIPVNRAMELIADEGMDAALGALAVRPSVLDGGAADPLQTGAMSGAVTDAQAEPAEVSNPPAGTDPPPAPRSPAEAGVGDATPAGDEAPTPATADVAEDDGGDS